MFSKINEIVKPSIDIKKKYGFFGHFSEIFHRMQEHGVYIFVS